MIAFHIALAGAMLALRQRLGRSAFLVGALGPLALLAWLLANGSDVLTGDPRVQEARWVPSLDLALTFRVDSYALLFLIVVALAGLTIFVYAARYFPSGVRVSTFAATMTAFAGAMVGLVASDHLLSLFLFWELTTITSYLLIGYADHTAEARSAALHAALVTGAGGLAMLAGFVMIGQRSGTWLISEISASPLPLDGTTGIAWALVLVGALTKSAQFPFHGWLPGAMAAPTPASAFLHSATMVKAGIFLVGRLAPIAHTEAEWWWPTVFALGFVTMVLGGWQALRQYDLKRLLAFGTVSQLGFMFLLLGSGNEEMVYGGLAILGSHALFKATLFMIVGTIDHEAGTRDVRRLHGLRQQMPLVFWVAAAASLSMAAVPLTIGFAAKEAAFEALLHEQTMLVAAAALASALTVAYTGRFLIGAFGASTPGFPPIEGTTRSPRNALVWSPAILAIVSVVLGVFPRPLAALVESATAVATGLSDAGKLVVWPGFGAALAWSAVSLGLGAVMLWQAQRVDRVLDIVNVAVRPLPTAESAFHRSIAGLLSFADRSVSTIQSGSLPAYLGIIATTAVVLPTVVVLSRPMDLSIRALGAGSALEMMLALVVVASAIALPFIGRRFGSMILLGGVGYGVAGLYAIFGGPDLALTQVLVETLALALFALVLRHLPRDFTRPRTPRAPRVLVAVAVSAFVFAGGLITNSVTRDSPIAERYLADSVPEAGGANVVNVILVDFRGFDTLGEITVLATAALGVAALVLPVVRKRREAQ